MKRVLKKDVGLADASRCAPTGFTLLELLVALAIMVTAFVLIATTLTSTLAAWRRGTTMLDELHHGDFVMEQVVSALRSTVFFDTKPELYGFRMTKNVGGSYPADTFSWVTSSSAFMPQQSQYANGLHRLAIEIGRNDGGDSGFSVRAMPYLIEEEDESSADSWLISTRVKGVRCRIYDEEDQRWRDDWEETNAIPSLVEVTLYVDSPNKTDPPLRIQRAIEIPVAPALTGVVAFVEGDE